MKNVVPIHVLGVHASVYASLVPEHVAQRVKDVSPPGHDGFRDLSRTWVGLPWEAMLIGNDPMLFQHVLPSTFFSPVRDAPLTYDDCLIAALNPAFHLANDGFQAWYRPLYILAGARFLGALHV